MIAQALRLHQTTIDHHISEFLNKGKLKPENGGSDSKLSAEQTAFLISQLSDNLFHHTRDVIAFVTRTWNIICKRTARAVLTGMCYSAGSAMRHGSSSLTRLTGQSAMTPSTWRR